MNSRFGLSQGAAVAVCLFLLVCPAVSAGTILLVPGTYVGGSIPIASVRAYDPSQYPDSPGFVTDTISTSFIVDVIVPMMPVVPVVVPSTISFGFVSMCYMGDTNYQGAGAGASIRTPNGDGGIGCSEPGGGGIAVIPVVSGVPFEVDVTLTASARYDIAYGTLSILIDSPLTVIVDPTPEPGSAWLGALGLVGCVLLNLAPRIWRTTT